MKNKTAYTATDAIRMHLKAQGYKSIRAAAKAQGMRELDLKEKISIQLWID